MRGIGYELRDPEQRCDGRSGLDVRQWQHDELFNAGNTTGYLGFSFMNGIATTNYGYAKFTTTAPSGYPADLVEYWYDNTGAAITIP